MPLWTCEIWWDTQRSFKGIELEVTESVVLDLVGTALFSSRGPQRMGWAHQTYAEFLAAFYLDQKSVADSRVRQLFSHPGDPDDNVPPQLHEPAAWYAALKPAFFSLIASREPGILLRSDVAALSPDNKRLLIESILDDPVSVERVDRDFEIAYALSSS